MSDNFPMTEPKQRKESDPESQSNNPNSDTKAVDDDEINLLEDFCVNTSGHGFFKIFENKNYWRIFWIIIMLLAFLGTTAHLILQLLRYLNYEINSETYYSTTNNLEIPDITYCPTNAYTLLNYFNDSFIIDPKEFYILPNHKMLELRNHYVDIWQFLMNVSDNRTMIGVARYSLMKQAYLANLLRSKYMNIYRTNFLNSDVDTIHYNDFPLYDSRYCTTFRAPIRQFKINDDYRIVMLPSIYMSDIFNALNDLFYTDQELKDIVPVSEFFVHEQNTCPDFKRGPNFHYLASGFLISYHQKIINRLSSTNKCVSNPDWIKIHGYGKNEYESFKYTKDLCVEINRSLYIYQNCKCKSELIMNSADIPEDIKYCHEVPVDLIGKVNNLYYISPSTMWNNPIYKALMVDLKSNKECHDEYFVKAHNLTFTDRCKEPCREIVYHLDRSTSKLGNTDWELLPTIKQSINEFRNLLTKHQVDNNNTFLYSNTKRFYDILSVTLFQKDHVRYFTGLSLFTPATLYSEVTDESLSYPMGNFFSDVGGILGLYLGFSAITILEIAELVIRAIARMCRCRKRKNA